MAISKSEIVVYRLRIGRARGPGRTGHRPQRPGDRQGRRQVRRVRLGGVLPGRDRQRPHPQELHARRPQFLAWVEGAASSSSDHPRRRRRVPPGLDWRPDQEAPPGGAAAILRSAGQPPRLRHQPGRDRQGRAVRVVEGKTPEIGPDQARTLLKSIDVSNPVGLRDRAVLAVLVYTAARVGAVAKLTMKSLKHDGAQYTLRFAEKGGKSREIPVRHDLEQFLLEYIQAAGITEGPLFRTANRKTKTLTKNAMTGIDICRMMKRRLKAAGLPGHFSPHSFRVTTVTDLLEQNVPLEDVQYLAGHADPRTTRIYDRRRRKVTRNIVERISI